MIAVAEDRAVHRGTDHHDNELAALIVLRDGHTTHWRLTRLDHDGVVDAWEQRMILGGRHYASLFSNELDVLRIVPA